MRRRCSTPMLPDGTLHGFEGIYGNNNKCMKLIHWQNGMKHGIECKYSQWGRIQVMKNWYHGRLHGIQEYLVRNILQKWTIFASVWVQGKKIRELEEIPYGASRIARYDKNRISLLELEGMDPFTSLEDTVSSISSRSTRSSYESISAGALSESTVEDSDSDSDSENEGPQHIPAPIPEPNLSTLTKLELMNLRDRITELLERSECKEKLTYLSELINEGVSEKVVEKIAGDILRANDQSDN